MSETRFHGARTKEETDITRVINDIDSSVIGVIVIADDADEDAFPLNIPTLITRPQSMLGKAGKTGTLYKTLKAISDQASAKIIVVRVATAKPPEEGKTAETQSQLILLQSGEYLSGMERYLMSGPIKVIGKFIMTRR